jgi:lysophospholipase L1-like esterase
VGVNYLDYSRLVDWPDPELTQADKGHPTAQGHRVVAAQLAKDLGILDGDGER